MTLSDSRQSRDARHQAQPALGERTEIMKIMTVAQAHIVPRIRTRTRGKA